MLGRLLVFNPGHEEALRYPNLASYTPPRVVRRMMADLAPLMRVLAREGDYIYCPSQDWASARLIDHRGQELRAPYDLPPLRLELWALEPHLIKHIARWAKAEGISLSLPKVSEVYTEMSHRQSATHLLTHLLKHFPEIDPEAELLPHWFDRDRADYIAYAERCEAWGYSHLVLKRPYSSSGRGVQSLSLPLQPRSLNLIERQIHDYGAVSLEPYLERGRDYALLLRVGAEGILCVGYSSFLTDSPSPFVYSGNVLLPDDEIERELGDLCGSHERWLAIKSCIIDYLSGHLVGQYEGYLGIDMMSYRSQSGQMRLHPAIELNMRCTMGVISHQLVGYYPDKRGGIYRLACFPQGVGRAWSELHARGAIALSPIHEETQFVAWVE